MDGSVRLRAWGLHLGTVRPQSLAVNRAPGLTVQQALARLMEAEKLPSRDAREREYWTILGLVYDQAYLEGRE